MVEKASWRPGRHSKGKKELLVKHPEKLIQMVLQDLEKWERTNLRKDKVG
jgi:hypothetical protein